MMPAKFAPLLFSFCLSIIMSCVVSELATLNVAGLTDGFAALWLAAWYKSWIVAFPTILVVASLTRRLVARLTRDEPDKAGRLHRQ
jgi:membrane protein implicated in regulation of membrane protease activity